MFELLTRLNPVSSLTFLTMVFSSPLFLFYFLPLFLTVYFLLPGKNLTLLLGSLLFYAWGEPRFVLVLVVSAALNYIFGYLISKLENKKAVLTIGIVVNLGMLFFYKYLDFAIQNVNSLLGSWIGAIPLPHYALPLGISFFTFQGISYLIDIYRGDIIAQKSFLDFAMYKAMFPQLIAGPIVRYQQIESQIHDRPYSERKVENGIVQFIIGLAQKVLIANSVGLTADQVFSTPIANLSSLGAWTGILCYSIQIFFDFAGYSNMAIGLGHILGFNYPPNFNQPYSSHSITEFWRRWHISLSSWFRDYLYIPLGGNRTSVWRTYLNLTLVFLICGLWHGAAWTFVIWGAWHGTLLVIERAGFSRLLVKAPAPLAKVYTLIMVMIGWVFFRANTTDYALDFLKLLVSDVTYGPSVHHWRMNFGANAMAALVLGIAFSLWDFQGLKKIMAAKCTENNLIKCIIVVVLVFLFILSAASLASGTYNPFIYFRF